MQDFQALLQVKSGLDFQLALWTNNSQIVLSSGSYVLAKVFFFLFQKSLFSNGPCLGLDHGKGAGKVICLTGKSTCLGCLECQNFF